MPTAMVRKHIILPKDLADAFEKLVGARRQSEEIAQLIKQRLQREERAAFFRANAGFVSADDHPEWATPAAINEWVRKLRASGWESAGMTESAATDQE